MKSSITILIFSLGLVGCSSSYIVSSLPHDDGLSFSEFNEEASGRHATIVFHDSSTLSGQDVLSRPDSTSWLFPATNVRIAFPTHKIKRIVFTDRLTGGLEGAAAGLLGGGGFGLMLGSAIEDPKSEWKGFVTLIFSVIGSGVGLLTGTIAGVYEGHQYNYEFEKQSDVTPSLSITTQPFELDDAPKQALFENNKKSSSVAVPLSLIIPSAGHAYAHNWNRGLAFTAGRVGSVVFAFTAGVNHIDAKNNWFYVGIASALAFAVWEAIDASDEVERYNQRLNKKIMGNEPLRMNIVPGMNGPQLQLSYSF